MAGEVSPFEISPFHREVRDTVVKSTFTGVAATAMAIVAFSPAGFGEWIGAGIASSIGVDETATAGENIYARLPAYPAPMTRAELTEIHAQLASSAASMTAVREATDGNLEQVRSLSRTDDLPSVMHQVATAPNEDLRLALSDPAEPSAVAANEAPVEAYVAASGPEVVAVPVNYTVGGNGGGYDASVPYRDPHLELADLLLAHESF